MKGGRSKPELVLKCIANAMIVVILANSGDCSADKKRHVCQVRNKAISKRETEKTIKEIWKEKMAETRAGKQTDLAEFMFNFFQKRVGISTAVIEVRQCVLASLMIDLGDLLAQASSGCWKSAPRKHVWL